MLEKLYTNSFIFAQAIIDASEVGIPTPGENSFRNGLNTVYFWAGVLAVIYIIVAGFRFVTSNGDSGQVAQARKGILGAVVGLVIVLSAFVITNYVIQGV